MFAALLHPCANARLAAAMCLRAVCQSLPSLLTPLIDRCLGRLEHLKAAHDAVCGYSLAAAALTSCVAASPLGIPFSRGRQLFATAEELLKSAAQSSRLALARTRAGWTLLAAFVTLGEATVRTALPRIQLLVKNVLPRSDKEAQAETQRGDAFTWTVTLEARAGALAGGWWF